MDKMRPIRKRCYLILELMIALFLIMTCLVPLLKPHVALYKLEAKRMREWKGYREDREKIVNLKQDLFEQKYSWEKLKSGFTAYNCTVLCHKKSETGLVLKVEAPYSNHYIFVEKER